MKQALLFAPVAGYFALLAVAAVATTGAGLCLSAASYPFGRLSKAAP
jgi:hypothetical protein